MDLLAEGRGIVAEARARGFPLRLAGSLAVRAHCPATSRWLDAAGRVEYRDLDFVGYAADANAITTMFTERGYVPDPDMLASQEYGTRRLIFERDATNGSTSGLKADVFLDDLVMCHTVHFRGRLEIDDPTIALSDLLLSKLQIVQLTDKDLVDLVALLAEHPVREGDSEAFDLARLLSILGRDWGFFRTATQNLERLLPFVATANLPLDARATVESRIRGLIDELATSPKSTLWRLRARIGTRRRWYHDVEDVLRD